MCWTGDCCTLLTLSTILSLSVKIYVQLDSVTTVMAAMLKRVTHKSAGELVYTRDAVVRSK